MRSIDIRVTDNLDIERGGLRFRHEGCYILKDRWRQACLNKIYMTIALLSLQDAEVIHITVVVQIQIIDHVSRRVEQLFELIDRPGLGKSGSYSLQVKIVREVVGERGYFYRGCGSWFGRCCNDGSCLYRIVSGGSFTNDNGGRLLFDINSLGRCRSDDTYRETSTQPQSQG